MGRLYYFHLFPSDKSIGFSVKCYAGCPARPQQARARDTARPRECRGFGQRLSADGFGQWLGEQTAPGNLGSYKKGEKDREPCRVAVVTSQLAMHGSCATHTRPQAHLPAARQGGLSDSPGHALCPKAASGSSRKCSFRKTGSPAPEGGSWGRWISAMNINSRLGSRRCGQPVETQPDTRPLGWAPYAPETCDNRKKECAPSSLLVITEASYKSRMRFSSMFVENLPRRKPVVVIEKKLVLMPQTLGEKNLTCWIVRQNESKRSNRRRKFHRHVNF